MFCQWCVIFLGKTFASAVVLTVFAVTIAIAITAIVMGTGGGGVSAIVMLLKNLARMISD